MRSFQVSISSGDAARWRSKNRSRQASATQPTFTTLGQAPKAPNALFRLAGLHPAVRNHADTGGEEVLECTKCAGTPRWMISLGPPLDTMRRSPLITWSQFRWLTRKATRELDGQCLPRTRCAAHEQQHHEGLARSPLAPSP